MELYATLSGIFTVATFVTFAGIVHWAWSARRRDAFAEAANAPFALPDEPAAGRGARQREREQAPKRVSARRVER